MIRRVIHAFLPVLACAGLVTIGLPAAEAAAAQPADTSDCSGFHPVDAGVVMQECINISNEIGSADTIIMWESGNEDVGNVTAQVIRDGSPGPTVNCGTLHRPTTTNRSECRAGANQQSGIQSWVAHGTWRTSPSVHGDVLSQKVGG